MKNQQPERILCAAIHYDDGLIYQEQPLNIKTGIVVAGRRHNNAFMTFMQLKPDYDPKLFGKQEGFITSHNRYVERPEAWRIALDQGQVDERKPSSLSDESLEKLFGKEALGTGDFLTSEDLYWGFDEK